MFYDTNLFLFQRIIACCSKWYSCIFWFLQSFWQEGCSSFAFVLAFFYSFPVFELPIESSSCISKSAPCMKGYVWKLMFLFLPRHVAERCGERVVLPLRTLIQHVCVKTPDRAEYRGKLSRIVVQLMDVFSDEQYSSMIKWINRFSRNSKVFRLFVYVCGKVWERRSSCSLLY